MIPNDLVERHNMINHMLSSLIHNDELDSWEQSFIESVSEQFNEKNNLTDRQCEKLEQIYDKYN